jgi:hypothetical protein
MISKFRNILLTKSLLRNTVLTVTFYAFSWLILELMAIYSPGGPCVPSGAAMLFFLLVPIVGILFVVNVYKVFAVSINYTISLFLHLVVLLWILYSICS